MPLASQRRARHLIFWFWFLWGSWGLSKGKAQCFLTHREYLTNIRWKFAIFFCFGKMSWKKKRKQTREELLLKSNRDTENASSHIIKHLQKGHAGLILSASEFLHEALSLTVSISFWQSVNNITVLSTPEAPLLSTTQRATTPEGQCLSFFSTATFEASLPPNFTQTEQPLSALLEKQPASV